MWAALSAAREIGLHGAGQSVALVSRDPYLTIRPRLYERSPRDLRTPLRPVLEHAGVSLLQGEAIRLDALNSRAVVQSADAVETIVPYKRLVLATGSKASMPPIPGLEEFAWSIDDFGSAVRFDGQLADLLKNRPPQNPLTIAIIGGGFTGIELACEMRDRIAVHAGEAAAQSARVFLFEKAVDIGPDLGPGPRPQIEQALKEARVEVHTGVDIARLKPDSLEFADGSEVPVDACVLTAGLAANVPPGLESHQRDALGRLLTDGDLRVSGAPAIFAAGDCAVGQVDDEHLSLMSCQHAMPMGRFAGHNAAHDLLGRATRTYSQPFYQTCLDLGRSGAVLTHGWEREVRKSGAEAGALKRNINTLWIYPPSGSRDEIFKVADIDYKPVR